MYLRHSLGGGLKRHLVQSPISQMGKQEEKGLVLGHRTQKWLGWRKKIRPKPQGLCLGAPASSWNVTFNHSKDRTGIAP